MGYGDIGPFGSKVNTTPHLDQMAEQGMKLTSFYAAPVCSASRAQLLTGCYAPRVSVPGVFFPAGSRGLNSTEITIAEYLRELGYATTCIGKWHVGDQPEFMPTNQGFDHYFGIPYSNDMQRVARSNGRRVIPLMRDDKVADLLEDEGQRRVTREYTEEAVKFIEAHRDDPFFLYLPHTAMHIPLYPHQDFVGTSNNGTYGDWVAEVDWSVGQILNTLRRNKLEKKTLVIFTSDNGPWASKGKAGGVSGPLRGSKGCTLEGGVREPTIAWWPGTIAAGTESDAIGGTTDILPTLVSLAGGQIRDDVKIDGLDLSPLLMGKTTKSPRNEWYYYSGTTLQAVRSGPWKLALTPQSLGMGIREKPKDLQLKGLRLYNLENEIGERTNVADAHPDVVARLKELADLMISDIGSGKPGPGVRPVGFVANPVTLYPTASRRSRAASPKTQTVKVVDWKKVQTGEAFASQAVGDLANRAYALHVQVDSPKTDAMLVAHGGTVVGYCLYVRDGNIVFSVRHATDKIKRVTAEIGNEPQLTVVAEVNATAIRLSVNGNPAVETKLVGPLGRQPQEDFCLGHDNGNPVDPQSPRLPYRGKFHLVRLEITKP
jgi:arylsulfatase A-like enzyme